MPASPKKDEVDHITPNSKVTGSKNESDGKKSTSVVQEQRKKAEKINTIGSDNSIRTKEKIRQIEAVRDESSTATNSDEKEKLDNLLKNNMIAISVLNDSTYTDDMKKNLIKTHGYRY